MSTIFEEKRSTDGVTPVRFNILGQMQIPGKALHLNSAFAHHPSLHFPLGLSLRHNDNHNHNGHGRSSSSSGESKDDSSPPSSDSPLDFSKKKPKLDKKNRHHLQHQYQQEKAEDSEEIEVTKGDSEDEEGRNSPASRLRNILSMKSPTTEDFIKAANGSGNNVLNLSKESPNSMWSSRASSPLSPSMENSDSQSQHSQSFLPSPRPAIAVNPGSGMPPTTSATNGGASGYPMPMSFSPWGNGMFSPTSLSPDLNQAAIPQQISQMAMETAAVLSSAPFSYPSPLGDAGANANLAATMQLPNGGGQHNNSSMKGRPTRPFKAYPKDPMTFPTVGMYSLPMGSAPGGTEALLHQQSHQAYAEFRKQMLASSQTSRSRRSNSGQRGSGGNSDSSTDGLTFSSGIGTSIASMDTDSDHGKNRLLIKSEQQMKDEAYWERRRKNNEAAKRSRDARRAKEDEIAIRAAFLEQENLKLRFEVCALKNETAKLRCMLYSS